MRRVWFAVVSVMLAITGTAIGAESAPESKSVHGEGCVQAGVEMRCLVVKGLKSGKLYNLLVKDPQPKIGDGIEFTGVPFDGASYCMQGSPLKVTDWSRKESLKCSPAEAPK